MHNLVASTRLHTIRKTTWSETKRHRNSTRLRFWSSLYWTGRPSTMSPTMPSAVHCVIVGMTGRPRQAGEKAMVERFHRPQTARLRLRRPSPGAQLRIAIWVDEPRRMGTAGPLRAGRADSDDVAVAPKIRAAAAPVCWRGKIVPGAGDASLRACPGAASDQHEIIEREGRASARRPRANAPRTGRVGHHLGQWLARSQLSCAR